jgi:hypothetical protein
MKETIFNAMMLLKDFQFLMDLLINVQSNVLNAHKLILANAQNAILVLH